MKHLSNINRTDNCSNQFGIENGIRDLFISLFCHSFSCSQQLKIFEIPTRKNLSHEIPTRKFGLMNYQWEQILNPRNTHEKHFGPTKYLREKNFGPTKYTREKISDPQNTHEGTITRRYLTHEIKHAHKIIQFKSLLTAKSLVPKKQHTLSNLKAADLLMHEWLSLATTRY